MSIGHEERFSEGTNRYGAMNTGGRLIIGGGKSKDVAFVHCLTCDEGIAEGRIEKHLSDGHTVEKVMKVENGDDGDLKEGLMKVMAQPAKPRSNKYPFSDRDTGENEKDEDMPFPFAREHRLNEGTRRYGSKDKRHA